ncbi:hypothetical protein COCNU_05G001710 [Cocos nucifera]|uniref:Uncharacterized protein n=1 Tax=Cocos nucifera TaxID=13894 RepID=A0A8K0I7H7_COCNU|nr:hypothetical protein COCNU_05G001710 [Cocos nucifera]
MADLGRQQPASPTAPNLPTVAMMPLLTLQGLIVTKCEVVSPSLEMEIKSDVEKVESGILLKPQKDEPGILLKPKQEAVSKSAAQIMHEQCRMKSNNETIPKRDIIVADDSSKTVTVSLWHELATNVGQELLDMAGTTPVVAIKCLKVGDFQGVSLSTLNRSTVLINPDLPESEKPRTWYDSEGKGTQMASVGSNMNSSSKTGLRYIMVVKVSDHSGEAWLSVFNEQPEKIIGCTADKLDRIKTEDLGSVMNKQDVWLSSTLRQNNSRSKFVINGLGIAVSQ